MKPANLGRDETRTRAYLNLLSTKEGLAQGKLAKAIGTRTQDLGKTFDPLLFERSGPRNRPIWRAKLGFLEESLLEHLRQRGMGLTASEEESVRIWLRHEFLAYLRCIAPIRVQPLRFSNILNEISRLAALARGTLPVKESWQFVDPLNLDLEALIPSHLRHRGVELSPRFEQELREKQAEISKTTIEAAEALLQAPGRLREKLLNSTNAGRWLAGELEILLKGLRPYLAD